ncbi:heterodisulfide reductase [Alkalispirochaeta odontotermitis]|nr:heterodisulfide reductase [Alkalispirochaeta odontotermitis]CAB1080042.1 Anaerobic respiratory complex protein QmoC [Olavius algarvensis Delta 1 endosymbiont]
MAETYTIDPDLDFINKVGALGGEDVKKCYQCATCSVACPISPDTRPFPRKEMIAASWGLKDKLVGNADIWLCHNCGDCSTRCPREAKPADVLAAVRSYTIEEYAQPKVLARALKDPKKLPILMAIPAILFLVVGSITGLLDFTPDLSEGIKHYKFFSTWLVDMHMLPAAIFAVAVFALGLKRFLADIHQNAIAEGKTNQETIAVGGFIMALLKVIPTILKHNKFSECTENNDRQIAHLLTMFGFIGLFIVTNIIFVVLYGSYLFPEGPIHGPWSQLNPVKWLANIAGIALIVGTSLMIKNRRAKKDQQSTYFDWYLIYLAFGLGVSGMGAQLTRLAGWAFISFAVYYVHLVLIFCLFAYLPFSKLAHLVYRTVAMAYNEYAGRNF